MRTVRALAVVSTLSISLPALAASQPAPTSPTSTPAATVAQGVAQPAPQAGAGSTTPTASPEHSASTPSAEVSAQPTAPAVQVDPEPVPAVEIPPAIAATDSAAESATPVAPEKKEDSSDLSIDLEKSAFKPGKGLIITSKDGKFSMALRSRVQLRYELERTAEEDAKFEQILSVRRARFQVAGNFFGKHNKYKLQLALSPRDMQFTDAGARNSPTLDAIVEFDYLRDFTVSFGQYMVPFNRQRIVSSGNFELVDRSLGNNEFQLDRDIGVQVSSNDLGGLGIFRYQLALMMGEGRDAYKFNDEGMLYVARVEYLPFGDSSHKWDYEEGDQKHVKRPNVSIGAAYAYDVNSTHSRGVVGNAPTDGGTTDFHIATADIVTQWRGFSLMGEFYLRQGKRKYGSATTTDESGVVVPAKKELPRDGIGWFVQGGYVGKAIPLGIAGRYSEVRGSGATSSLKDSHEISAGPSWYISTHNLKVQADYGRFWAEKLSEGADVIRVQLSAGF